MISSDLGVRHRYAHTMSNSFDWTVFAKPVNDLLAGLQANPVLRAHVAFLQERLETARLDYEDLEQENANLKTHVSDLWSQLQPHLASEQFVEHRGALFKRLSGGGYHQTVYCPLCKSPAGHSPGMSTPFLCKRFECDWFSDFAAADLPQILDELPE